MIAFASDADTFNLYGVMRGHISIAWKAVDIGGEAPVTLLETLEAAGLRLRC